MLYQYIVNSVKKKEINLTTIMVDARLGVTMDNIPADIFHVIQGDFGSNNDGGIRFNVNNENREVAIDSVRRFAMSINRQNVEVVPTGTSIVTIKPRVAEQAEQMPPEGITDGLNAIDDNNDDGTTDPEPIAGVRRPADIRVEQRPAGIVEIPEGEVEQHLPLNPEAAMLMVAATLENEVSSLARNLRDKQRRFEREWTKVINLKRAIDDATAPIESHPIISSMISQVSELSRNENLIEQIYFIDGFVIVKTKELITENAIEGHRRVIGKMQIKINLKPVIGNSSECADPVIIKNLDRKYYDGNTHWECGHTPSGGRGMCWGTAWEMLFHSMADRDLGAIIETIIRFIKNPNPADAWGRHIKHWPEAPAENTLTNTLGGD